ncbi:penicillin-binding protein 1A [Albidovulum inexpectatum]|uniref:Penicillin-binding protein 1A n=1 Tax=Albidovulum inexpectatum TaxID=196587 RepID=A0A2S5JK31_9RHOB|nr:PBP1A family penicillin-binding protein [Albidovulum inexpectatum]PPB81738.1 penicillin-binding protein 1A [Albidovulum inexpectatum]
MTRFILSFLGGIFSWIVTGLFFAALAIGGVFWIYSRDLPDHEYLAQYTPKTISRIYSGEGRLMDEFATERRIFAPIEDIPDIVKWAFISAEDKNFYSHQGFDARGIAGAIWDAIRTRGQTLRGASTIPQQVAKNFLLGGERTVERKIKEMILANRLVNTLPRDKILELYLNEIDLGYLSFGVASAAQTYFNKTLSELTVEEAAYLAALPKAPYSYHPVKNREAAIARRNYVLREMYQNGYIDAETMKRAQAQPLRTVQGGDYPSFKSNLPPRDYFTDEIRRQLSKSFGAEEFFGGGLTIRATVDPEMQLQAARALQEALEKYDRNLGVWRGTRRTIPAEELADETRWRSALAEVDVPRDIPGWLPAVVLEVGERSARIGIEGVSDDDDGHWIPAEDVTWARKRQADGRLGPKAKRAGDLVSVGDVVLVTALTDKDGTFKRWSLRQVPEVQGAFMAMDVHTGRVIAMQGGFSYQSSVFNRATQAMRQPGSAFKPFVYAAALDSGFSPATIVVDAPIEVDTPEGVWRPKNASNKFYGPTPLRTGIEQSRNLMTIRVAQEVGMDTVARYAERFGVYDRLEPYLANSLGAQETTLFKMVAAYAMFANGGERVEPTLVDRVQDRWGKTVYRHDRRKCLDCADPNLPPGRAPRIESNRERVMDPVTAYQLTSMLQGVVQRGSGKGVNLPVPTAGKTGTTNDAKDVWFIGFTSNIVAGCYMGYDQPRSLGRGAYGGTLCVPVFNAFMQEAVKKYGGSEFKVPPGGHFIKINRFTGERLPDDAEGDYVQAEFFRDGMEPIFGIGAMVDGGFAMGQNLPLYSYGELGGDEGDTTVTTSSGKKAVIPKKADFGTVSSGGLY